VWHCVGAQIVPRVQSIRSLYPVAAVVQFGIGHIMHDNWRHFENMQSSRMGGD
jgi:hypothetical protein